MNFDCINCGKPFGQHGATHDCPMFVAPEERIVNTFGALTKNCTPEEVRLLAHYLAALRARRTLEALT